jgi:hypothetical protein
MRPRAFFDDGLFFMSFSLALGVIALIIPAKGATPDPAGLAQMNESGAGRAERDLPAALAAAPAASASTGMSDMERRTLIGAVGGPNERGFLD